MIKLNDSERKQLTDWIISKVNELQKENLKQLSYHSGVSEKTIHRILQGKTMPRPKNCLRLGEALISILGLIPPTSIKHLFQSRGIINKPVLKDSISKEIFIRSALKPLYKEEINYLFGDYGLMALRELIELDFIRFNGNEYIAKEQVIEQPPRFFRETLQQLLGHALVKKGHENHLSPHLIRKIYQRFNVFLDNLILELSENSP